MLDDPAKPERKAGMANTLPQNTGNSNPPEALTVVDLAALSTPLQLFECVTYLCHPFRDGPDVRLHGLGRDLERFLFVAGLAVGTSRNLATQTALLRAIAADNDPPTRPTASWKETSP
jgi:hypothetical protein